MQAALWRVRKQSLAPQAVSHCRRWAAWEREMLAKSHWEIGKNDIRIKKEKVRYFVIFITAQGADFLYSKDMEDNDFPRRSTTCENIHQVHDWIGL
ncbi:hypothetical protein J31TS4_20410 [Paenibacillus sp. J31TS4]|nr:hypothetical protein J31TS4_20410 [Paenibacillus sp. J31TS4]